MADQIAQLLAQLGAMNYKAPSSYKGYQSQTNGWHVNRSLPDWKPADFKVSDFQSLKKPAKSSSSGLGINLWDVLSGTLGQPSGFVTSIVDDVVKKAKKDFSGKGNILGKIGNFLLDANPATEIGGTLANAIGAGAKEQWKDWTDGKFSWGDIPLVGFLHGTDKNWKRGSDIMKDVGVKNGIANTAGGLAADIAFDPLTYLTIGLSAASKVGKAAELAKIAEEANKLGIAGKYKNTDEFLNAATDTLKNNMMQKMPNVSESVIDRTVAKKIGDIADNIKTARNTAYNSHVNAIGLSIPRTTKFVKLGEMGSKNPLYNSEVLAPQQLVDNLLHEASMGSPELKNLLNEAVQARYGVDHTGQLTKTMFDDLHAHLSPIIDQIKNGRALPDVKVTQQVVEHAMPQEDFTRLMDAFKNQNIKWKDVQGQLDQILAQTAHDPVLRSSIGSHLAQMVSDYWKAKPAKNFSGTANKLKAESMKWASQFLKESDAYKTVKNTVKEVHPNGSPEALAAKDTHVFNKQFGKLVDTKYNEMGDFKSNIAHWFDKKNIFNARTLATGDKFVNSMAEHIADANSQRIGETARYSRSLDKIQGYLDKYKGDKQQLMEQAIYILENHAPDAIGGKAWLKNAPKEAVELANRIRPVIDRLGSEEQKAGVLNQLRANYFPHVVNQDPETMNAIQDFMKRNPLAGNSTKNKFNQERKSFQTLAERDNYIKDLEKAIQKETDPAKVEKLREQQDRVAKMFDTDVVSALQRRIKEGVRAKAMKEMQTKLSKYGMMKTLSKDDKHIPNGLVEISKDDAKKLGLGEGRHYIHPQVLDGMKRVDDIFTSQGMNKFVRHMTAIADAWRPLVTYYKPSHYINNFIGNVINNLAAGVKASDYRAAGKLLKGYKDGKLTDSQMKIIEAAYKHNVISGGFLHDSQKTFSHELPSKLEKFAEKVANNKAIKAVRHTVGEKVDDLSRLANFINGYEKYGDTAKAAKQVQTYLFNYNELTNADRAMRVLVPFWNWTKRNVPLQMKLLMENPKFAMNNMRFMQLFNQNQNGADWQKESGLHIPKEITDALGSKNEYYTSFSTPVLDLKQVLNPSELLGSMTPVAKVPIEMSLNKKFYTDKPISYGSDTIQPTDILPYLASNLGIGGNMFDAMSGKKSIPESLVNFLHSITKVNSKNPNGG
jgi:hypothetical protein